MRNRRFASKLLPLFLAVVLSSGVLASCAESRETAAESDGNPDRESATEAQTEKPDPVEDALNRIGDVDWGNREFTILYAEDMGYGEEVDIKKQESDDEAGAGGGVIRDAVYERNTLLEERCHLKLQKIGQSWETLSRTLRMESQSPSHEFDMAHQILSDAGALAPEGRLYNFLNFGDIDYTAPWWDQGTLAFNLGGRVFFMSGAHNVADDGVTYAMAFNKRLLKDLQMESPYLSVENGEWTLDCLHRLVQFASSENGDGQWDENDRYGFAVTEYVGSNLFYGANLHLSRFNEETGYPELAMDSTQMEKASHVLDLSMDMLFTDHRTYRAPNFQFFKALDVFRNGNALFYNETIQHLREFSTDMEDEFGILPQPKYDREQEDYYTWVAGCSSTLVLPSSVDDTGDLSRILETYVALSYRFVTPAFCDTVLAMRTAQDPQSAKSLQVLLRNRIYDLPQYYDFGLANIFREALYAHKNTFVSRYAAVGRSFDRKVRTLFRNLDKIDG